MNFPTSDKLPPCFVEMAFPVAVKCNERGSWVYAFASGIEIIYIGQTICLASRLRGHSYRPFADRVWVACVPGYCRLETEWMLISSLMPKLNRTGNPSKLKGKDSPRTFRVPDDEWFAWSAFAESRGLSITKWLRELARRTITRAKKDG